MALPYADAADLLQRIAESHANENAKAAAQRVVEAIDALVVKSYHGLGFFPAFNNFQNGVNGVYIVGPLNKIYSKSSKHFWSHCGWYSPDDKSNDPHSFGLYRWCTDGATAGNGLVENWYELLNAMYGEP